MYRSGAAATARAEPGQAKEFIQDKLRSAQWLIRSIHQRQRTIYKVTESIVKFQRDFLDKGIAYLKPLILRDVAEDIGMHESTVSPRDDEQVRAHAAGHLRAEVLLQLVDRARVRRGHRERGGEAPHQADRLRRGPRNPYSDQKIVELLKAQGIEIARRTVAKYREVLGVLPSSKRKRYF